MVIRVKKKALKVTKPKKLRIVWYLHIKGHTILSFSGLVMFKVRSHTQFLEEPGCGVHMLYYKKFYYLFLRTWRVSTTFLFLTTAWDKKVAWFCVCIISNHIIIIRTNLTHSCAPKWVVSILHGYVGVAGYPLWTSFCYMSPKVDIDA